MVLNLHQLRVFQAIVEAGSVTSGARALHISQPAASKQLAELEHSLGAALLERRSRGVVATAAGEVLRHHAAKLFREERAAEHALSALWQLQVGKLRIGANTTVGNYCVPVVLGRLHREHPKLSLELTLGNTAWLQEQLLSGHLDVGLSEQLPTTSEVQRETFLHDELVLIVAPDHAWAKAYSVAYEKLHQLPFLIRESGCGTQVAIEAALAQRGIKLQPVMSLGSTQALKTAVEVGLGVAFVSRRSVEAELRSNRLQELRVAGLTIHRELHQLTVAGSAPSPAAGEFLRHLRLQYPRSV